MMPLGSIWHHYNLPSYSSFSSPILLFPNRYRKPLSDSDDFTQLTNGYSRQKPLAISGQRQVKQRFHNLLKLLKQEMVNLWSKNSSECSFHASGSRRCLLYHQVTITRLLGKLQEQSTIIIDSITTLSLYRAYGESGGSRELSHGSLLERSEEIQQNRIIHTTSTKCQ